MIFDIIENNRVKWYEVEMLDERDKEIQKIINQLDEFAVQYEIKWGVGILQKYCSPELLEKWMRQCEKFSEAMQKKDVELIRELASGFKRAYEALENDVLTSGVYEPHQAMALCYRQPDGTELIVCSSNDDARIMTAKRKGNYKTDVWTIAQVAEIIFKEHNLLKNIENSINKNNQVKEPAPFDFNIGDSTEF